MGSETYNCQTGQAGVRPIRGSTGPTHWQNLVFGMREPKIQDDVTSSTNLVVVQIEK